MQYKFRRTEHFSVGKGTNSHMYTHKIHMCYCKKVGQKVILKDIYVVSSLSSLITIQI